MFHEILIVGQCTEEYKVIEEGRFLSGQLSLGECAPSNQLVTKVCPLESIYTFIIEGSLEPGDFNKDPPVNDENLRELNNR